MPIDLTKIPQVQPEEPTLTKYLRLASQPIAEDIPGAKEALEKFAQPGLNTSPTMARIKGFLSGAAGAITPGHIATALALPEMVAGAGAVEGAGLLSRAIPGTGAIPFLGRMATAAKSMPALVKAANFVGSGALGVESAGKTAQDVQEGRYGKAALDALNTGLGLAGAKASYSGLRAGHVPSTEVPSTPVEPQPSLATKAIQPTKEQLAVNKAATAEIMRDQKNLADVQKWRQAQIDKRIADANAIAQQSKVDEVVTNPANVKTGGETVTQTTKGKSSIGEAQSLREKFGPPKSEGGEGDGGEGPVLSHFNEKDAIKEAKKFGGAAKWNIQRSTTPGGPVTLVPRTPPTDLPPLVPPTEGVGPTVPPGVPPSTPPTGGGAGVVPSDLLTGKNLNKADAQALAKHLGGEATQVGPRVWRVKFPQGEAPTPEAPTEPTPPTPDQAFGAGEASPMYSQPPLPAPDVSAVPALKTGDLSPDEFKRYMDIRPGMGKKLTPAELDEYKSLQDRINNAAPPTEAPAEAVASPEAYPASWDQIPPEEPPTEAPVIAPKPKGPKGPKPSAAARFEAKANKIAAAAAEPTPAPVPPVLADTAVPTVPPVEPTPVPPQINAVGEAEPTLPGIEPTINPAAAPVAEAPFGLTPPPAVAPKAPVQPPLITKAPDPRYPGNVRVSEAPTTGPDLFSQATAPQPPQDFNWPEAGGEFTANPEGSTVLKTPPTEQFAHPYGKPEVNIPIGKDGMPVLPRGYMGPDGIVMPDGKVLQLQRQLAEPTSGAIPVVEAPGFLPKPSLEDAKASYDRIKAAKESGAFVPEEVRSAAGSELQQLENEAKVAPETPKGPQLTPEEQQDVMGAQKLIADPETKPLLRETAKRWLANFMSEKGLGGSKGVATTGLTSRIVGAGIGGYAGNQSDPLGNKTASTLAGAGAGFMAPEIIGAGAKAIPAVADLATRAQPYAEKGIDLLNRLHNTGLLSPLSVVKKAAGDIGGLTLAGIEHPEITSDLIKQFTSPQGRALLAQNFRKGFQGPEAEQAAQGLENFFQKGPLSWSGRMMGGLTQATKGAMGQAGLSPEMQQYYTLTKYPSTNLGKRAIQALTGSKIAQHLSPFARIGINRLERGIEYSPLGLLSSKLKDPAQATDVIKKALLGTGVGAAAYNATPENFVKEHPTAASTMAALAGPLSVPVLAAMSMKSAKKAPGDTNLDVAKKLGAASETIGRDIPGLRLLEDITGRQFPEGFARNYFSGYTNVGRPIDLGYRRLTGDTSQPDVSSNALSEQQKIFNRMWSNIPGVSEALPKKGGSGTGW